MNRPSRPSRNSVPDGAFIGAPRFEYVRTLGSGGMGIVHEVFDTERRVRMALKALHANDAESILYFKREFRALCDLRHPNLVSLGDLVEARGEYYFTMELVEGTDFLSHVRPQSAATTGSRATETDVFAATIPLKGLRNPFQEERLRGAFRQLAAGLMALHGAGKIHRDLKPSNVLVTPQDRVVLLDFGLVTARSASQSASRDQVVGTVLYMAPEQAFGGGVGPAADWYAFGTMLYQALTGSLPFEGPSMVEVLRKKKDEEPESPVLLAPDAPRDLVALCRALLRPAAKDRADDEAIREALGVEDDRSWVAVTGFGAPEQPFVGRKDELAELDESFARFTEGRSVAVVVEGESGVGKSALVERFVRRLKTARMDAVVLRSHCREDEALSYRAFDGWMDDLSRVLLRMDRARVIRMAPRHTDALLELFPCLATVRALTDVVDSQKQARKAPESETQKVSSKDPRVRAFAAAIDLLRNVAARRPLVAVIDDLQWADPDSLLLLKDLLAPQHVPQWCLIVTERRSKGEEPCAARRLIRGEVKVLSLGGLGADEARELARALMEEGGALSPGAVDEAVKDSRGHPLFLGQLVGHLGRARPSAQGTLTLDDALWDQIAALPATARYILGILAVAGSPVALGPLATAAEVRPEVFVTELSRLRAARLVRVHGSRRDDTAETYHNRVRETLLARLHEKDRRGLHRALAMALEATGAEEDRVALQWHKADEPGRALEWAKRSLRPLEEGAAFGRAAEMVRLVLAVADPEGAERGQWLVRLAELLGRAGRPKEAAAAFVEAAELAHMTKEQRIELLRRATEQLLTGGFLDEGVALAREVLGALGVAFPEGRWTALLSTAWNMWRSRGAELAPAPAMGTTDAEVEARKARHLRLDARWTVGAGLMMLDPTRGTALLASGLGEALAHGDPARRARALCAAAVAECASGAEKHAQRFVEAAEREASTAGSGEAGLYANLARAAVAFLLQNDYAASLAALQEAEARLDASGASASWERAMIEQYTCFARYWTGDLNGYRIRAETALRDAHLGGHRYLEAAMRTLSPPALLFDDDPDNALAEIDEAERSWLPGRTGFTIVDYWCLKGRTEVFAYRPRDEDLAPLVTGWRAFDGSWLRRVPLLAYESALLQGGLSHVAARLAMRARNDEEEARWKGRAAAWARRLKGPTVRVRQHDADFFEVSLALMAGDASAVVIALKKTVKVNVQRGHLGNAQAARYLMGQVIGGDRGRALVAESHGWFQSQGVRNPEAFARMVRYGASP